MRKHKRIHFGVFLNIRSLMICESSLLAITMLLTDRRATVRFLWKLRLLINHNLLNSGMFQNTEILTWHYSSTDAGDNSLYLTGVSDLGTVKAYPLRKVTNQVQWVIREGETLAGPVDRSSMPTLTSCQALAIHLETESFDADLPIPKVDQLVFNKKSSEAKPHLSFMPSIAIPVNLQNHKKKMRRGRGAVVPNTMGRALCGLSFTQDRSLSTKTFQSDVSQGRIPNTMIKRLETLSKLFTHNPDAQADGLMRILKDSQIWVAAYIKLKTNPGSMTEGGDKGTIDGTSLKRLLMLRDSVLDNTYLTGRARRKNIPKPQGGTRPLGIPTFRDRIVQEVIRSILETIYEPVFHKTSHGFRPGLSQHTALRDIRKNFRGASWFVEGDISKCFDKVDHTILIRLLRKRIADEKFLSLIKKILVNIVKEEDNTETVSIIGTPQGGICSPLLSNVYLHEFDLFMENLKENYDTGTHRRRNPEYDRRYRKGGVQEARKVSYGAPNDPYFRRLGYVRYADDFLIGIIGPIREAREIREQIRQFLKDTLNLELNMEKTKISNPSSHKIKFLGYVLGKSGRNAYTYIRKYQGTKRKIRVIRGGSPYLKVDTQKVIKALAQKGFCDGKGFPKPNFYYLPEPQTTVIRKYTQILRGLERYYHLADNKRQAISKFNYILRYSAAKLFAAKYKLKSMSKVFALGGKDLSKPIKSKNAIGITDSALAEMEETVTNKPSRRRTQTLKGLPFTKYSTISKPDIGVFTKYKNNHPFSNPLESLTWRTIRGVDAFKLPCAICGAENNVEMHHIRQLKNLKGKDLIEKKMISAMRKQIPLCRKHHLAAHGKKMYK